MVRTLRAYVDDEFAAADDIPFPAESDAARDETLREAAAYRKAGGRFYTADEFMAHMRAAIKEGANSGGI